MCVCVWLYPLQVDLTVDLGVAVDLMVDLVWTQASELKGTPTNQPPSPPAEEPAHKRGAPGCGASHTAWRGGRRPRARTR